MRRSRRILLTVVVVLLVVAVGGYWYARPLLLTGTGYAAHNACAVHFVAGRDNPAADLPPNPLVPYLRTDVGAGRTSTSVLGVLAGQTAWFTPGYGCTLAEHRPGPVEPTPVSAEGNPYTSAPSPTPPAGVRAAVDRAFGADLPAAAQDALGTRAVVVLHHGELVAERYAEGFDRHTPQLGWSMTKSVTNMVVGRLVKQGRISLDDTHLRPEWEGDERSRISIRMLLQMTSGLAWDETYALGTPITRMLYLESDMGDYVASQPLAHEPSSYQQYSSGSTTLLCDILAERTGAGPGFPRQLLFAPLGLSSAVLEPDASGTPVCSSYLWATPRDWAAIGQLALQDGVWNGERLLPRGWMEQSTETVEVTSQEGGYASGWWVNERVDGTLVHPALPADAYFAQGHDGQFLIIVPSEELVVVRTGFTPTRESTRAFALAVDLIAALD